MPTTDIGLSHDFLGLYIVQGEGFDARIKCKMVLQEGMPAPKRVMLEIRDCHETILKKPVTLYLSHGKHSELNVLETETLHLPGWIVREITANRNVRLIFSTFDICA